MWNNGGACMKDAECDLRANCHFGRMDKVISRGYFAPNVDYFHFIF